jgi:hypothetical protein
VVAALAAVGGHLAEEREHHGSSLAAPGIGRVKYVLTVASPCRGVEASVAAPERGKAAG